MMEKKLKGGVKGQPHWLVERDVRRRTSLPQNGGVKGGGTKLGGAEKLLCTRFARMAQQGMPYLTDEVDEIVRDTCIELGLSDHLGQPYHADSNVSKLAQNFIRRCEEDGIPLVCKNGTKLAKIRADSAHIEALVAARDNVIRHPENGLLKFQKDRKIKLTLLNVFNWDEAQVDLCDFASIGMFLMLDGWPNNVITPYDQSPHFTIITGFCGRVHLVALFIRIGSEFQAPHPFHSELLQSRWTMYLAQSPTGWADIRLKTMFFELQVECPHVPIGNEPTAGNSDGHITNTNNLALTQRMREVDVGFMALALLFYFAHLICTLGVARRLGRGAHPRTRLHQLVEVHSNVTSRRRPALQLLARRRTFVASCTSSSVRRCTRRATKKVSNNTLWRSAVFSGSF